jgi:hypothetical protein
MPLLRNSRLFPGFWLLCAAGAHAHREDYIDETLVFVTIERGAVEPEYWFDAGRDDSGRFTRHHLALEYGITRFWMIDGRVTWLDGPSGGLRLDASRVETRYRFFEEGTQPIDAAVSGEINSRHDENGRQIAGVEPRLILSKDFGKLNFTLNSAVEIPLNRGGPSSDARAGWRYDATDHFRLGAEFHYDSEGGELALIPQIWLIFLRDAAFKAGYSHDFAARHERFLRLALELEF